MKKFLLALLLLNLLISTQASGSIQGVDFTSISGDDQVLDQFLGKPVVIELISTSCSVCAKQHPVLVNIMNSFGENLQLLTLSSDERDTLNDMKNFLLKFPMNWTTGLIRDYSFLEQFNAKYVFPTFLFFSSQGEYLACTLGYHDETSLGGIFSLAYSEDKLLTDRYGGPCEDITGKQFTIIALGLSISLIIAIYMIYKKRLETIRDNPAL